MWVQTQATAPRWTSCLEWSSSGIKSCLILRTHWHFFHLWWNPALKEARCFLRGLICITASPCHRGSVCRVTASRWSQERQSNRAFQAVFSKLNTGHPARLSGSSVIAEKASSSHTNQRTNTNRCQFLLTRTCFQLRAFSEVWEKEHGCILSHVISTVIRAEIGNCLGSQFKLRQWACQNQTFICSTAPAGETFVFVLSSFGWGSSGGGGGTLETCFVFFRIKVTLKDCSLKTGLPRNRACYLTTHAVVDHALLRRNRQVLVLLHYLAQVHRVIGWIERAVRGSNQIGSHNVSYDPVTLWLCFPAAACVDANVIYL